MVTAEGIGHVRNYDAPQDCMNEMCSRPSSKAL